MEAQPGSSSVVLKCFVLLSDGPFGLVLSGSQAIPYNPLFGSILIYP